MMLATSADAGEAEKRALELINAQRARAGCPGLVVNPRLQAAAAGHARDMAKRNFFGHEGSNGSDLSNRIGAQGYRPTAWAENIAAGYSTAENTVMQWKNSLGHRRNMLNCRYRETGIARYYQADDEPLAGKRSALKSYWVQVFASR